MSAITGIYHLNAEPINIEHGLGLMKVLQKYPSHEVGIWNNNCVFFGCHAQWITPESVNEVLPFHDYERQLSITSDAIIDNRNELFEKLQIKQSRRKTITDSELLLHSYSKWDENAPKHIIGDFAFMIWDEKKQKLFGARDFSGSRTLYFYRNGQKFAFCTAIMPLFSLPYVKKELNEQWLAEYLAISGMIDAVDASITPYKYIEQIPPSHSISIVGGKIKFSRYSTLNSGKPLKLKSKEEYVEAFQEVFQLAVSSRLRTYLNVGAQLSGGLDSGAVVGFAAKVMRKENKKLNTFSYIPPKDFVDFTSKQLLADERPFIQSTVQFVGNLNDHYLDFEGKNSYTEIEEFLEILEMPYKFFENSFWLKGMFEKAFEEKIGVLLNGDRGNFTISWGYALDYYAILLKKMKWIRLFHELKQYSINTGGARFRNLPIIARVAFPVIDQIFPQGTPYTRPMIINQDFAKRTGVFEKFKEHGINKSGWYNTTNIYHERKKHFEDVFHWNAGNTLASKLSLRYLAWKRDPTNDLRIVRFCLSVPEGEYVQNGLDRALIRNSTKNYLPDNVRLNQRIRGVQGADWVHRMVPSWDNFINEARLLSKDKKILDYLDGSIVNTALLKIEDGVSPENAINPYYKILMRSLIVYRFIKKFA